MFYLKNKLLLATVLLILFSGSQLISQNLMLYTPYTKISVSPGESVEYTIDAINNSGLYKNLILSVKGLPKGWNYEIKSGGWNISQLAVLNGEKKSFSLKIDVPFIVSKGTYKFNIAAEGYYSLPLCIVVTQEGTSKSEFTCKQPSMEGHAASKFTFNADLRNRSSDRQLYALSSDAPRGWTVVFKSNYNQVSSVNIEPGNIEKLTIEINPPDNIKAGRYKIPVHAITNISSADLDLEVVVTGSYGIELTTPRGLMSTNITAGKTKRIELVVKNTGSSDLTDIEFDYSAPVNWEVGFDPKKVDKLEAGKEAKVIAIVKADKKAITGDYVTNLEAKTPEVSSKASFRISVRTPLIYGWIGVLIILFAIWIIYYLFKKYGRR